MVTQEGPYHAKEGTSPRTDNINEGRVTLCDGGVRVNEGRIIVHEGGELTKERQHATNTVALTLLLFLTLTLTLT